ncbi:MAG: BtrH N-terminal domain-containing protein [Thermodesulfobacteriota bacterium]
MIMLPVRHTPGRHCGSTGIRDLVNFHGLDYDEPLCFGIGAGMGLWYLKSGRLPASRMIHVRSLDLENQFFTRIGTPFEWQYYADGAESETALRSCLDRGLPAIIQTDIFHLPYYGSSTHFPGHLITAWGYDDGRRLFFVTDTERPEIQEVPFDNMKEARFSGGGIFDLRGNLFAPETIAPPADLPDVIRRAIVFNSRVLLDDGSDLQGLRALAAWQEDLDHWPGFDDWQWTARLAYQIIEKRGTGGGGFRLMYRDFLAAARALLPGVITSELVERMEQTALAWTALAAALKASSEKEAPDFSEVNERLSQVRECEAAYHESAVRLQ